MSRDQKIGYGKKIAVLSLMAGLGLVSFMLEGLFPSPVIPGAKLGISNIFSLMTLVLYGFPEAALVVVVRTVLGSLFAGNLSMLLYSLTAGLASVAVSRLLFFAFPKISVLAISIVSAVVHNTVQLLVYCALTGTILLMGYLPVLAALGAGAGVFVGLTVVFMIKAVPLSVYSRIAGVKLKTEERI